MQSTNNNIEEDRFRTSSNISCECHSILLHFDFAETLNSHEPSDDENSECDNDSFSSDYESDNVDEFETFQDLVARRKVSALAHGVNLLSCDIDWENEDEDSEDSLTKKESNSCTAASIFYCDFLETTRISTSDCNDGTSSFQSKVSDVNEFERRAVQKKINTGKIRECNTRSSSGFLRYQYIRRNNTFSSAY